MIVFNLQTKRNLCIWSFVLSLFLVFVIFYLSLVASPICIDSPCDYNLGWPVNYFKRDTNSNFDNSRIEFKGLNLKIYSISNLYNIYSPTKITTEFIFLNFIIDWLILFVLVYLLLFCYKKYIKLNKNAVIVLSILHLLFFLVILILILSIIKLEITFQKRVFFKILNLSLFLIPPFISVAIFSSEINRKSRFVASLIFLIPSTFFLFVFGMPTFKNLDLFASVVSLFFLSIFLAPLIKSIINK